MGKRNNTVFVFTDIYPTSEEPFIATYLYYRVLYLRKNDYDVWLIKTKRGSIIKSIKRYLVALVRRDSLLELREINLYSNTNFFNSNRRLPNKSGIRAFIDTIFLRAMMFKLNPSVLIFHFLWYTEPLYWLRFFNVSVPKVVVHLHGSDINFIEEINFSKSYIDLVLNQSDACFFSSNALMEKLLKIKNIAIHDKSYVTFNGWRHIELLDLDSNIIEDINNKREEGYTIIAYVGNLYKPKGILEFLLVGKILIEELCNVCFLCIGGGDYSKYVEEYIFKNELNENFKYLGPLEPSKVHRCLQITDILINPSWSEGFSTINVEAQSYGVPVICFNVGGNKETIRYHDFIIPWHDSFKERVKRIIKEVIHVRATNIDKDKIKLSVDYFHWDNILKQETRHLDSLFH